MAAPVPQTMDMGGTEHHLFLPAFVSSTEIQRFNTLYHTTVLTLLDFSSFVTNNKLVML
jgi:hypothetical protein